MLVASASVLAAQAGTPPQRPVPPMGAGGQPAVVRPGRRGGQMGRMTMPDSARRQQMQARMGNMLKQRFGFSDAQATKFSETNQKFAERARLLGEQDRDVRMALRDEMLRADSARPSQLSALLDTQATVRRQRADVVDAREKELASYLTPLQRAKLSNARGAMRGRGGMRDGHSRMRAGMRPGMGGRGGMIGMQQHPTVPPQP
jgi:hypothetical protein